MKLLLLAAPLSFCKLRALPAALPDAAPLFFARTDEEFSLLCPTSALPEGLLCRDDGWRALRVEGPLDFSLVGILSRLTGLLAGAGIPLSAVSTYDTDYLFLKEDRLCAALSALRQAGETVEAESAAVTAQPT